MVSKKTQIAVIGAGAGGLVVSVGAARAHKKVVLIEKGTYGGDCTNFGCIPSKSLIASAHSAHAFMQGKELGVEFSKIASAEKSLERVRRIIEDIRSHEEPEALGKLGIDTMTGFASFVDPHTIQVKKEDGSIETVYADKIVISTGSSPFIPKVEGLNTTPFLTNETIFSLKEIPKSLIVVGGGPIGCELAEAFSRLGSEVFLVHSHEELLGKEEPLAQEVIAKSFAKEGIGLYLGYQTKSVSHKEGKFFLNIEKNDQKVTLQGQHLLVSTGRRPNVMQLNLSAAKVAFSEKGIPVDAYCRTSQKHIFAIGDVTGGPLFTHYAENMGRTVLTTLLLPFGLKKKMGRQSVPRVTYTDPEVASIGLLEKEAKALHSSIAVYNVPLTSVDRAITTGRTEGFIKIITSKWSSQILGATIVAPRAGEMLMQISIAMYAKFPLRKMSGLIHPYPTYSLGIRKAADLWLTQTLLSILTKKNS